MQSYGCQRFGYGKYGIMKPILCPPVQFLVQGRQMSIHSYASHKEISVQRYVVPKLSFSNAPQRPVYGVVASRRVLCTIHIVVFSCFIFFSFFSVGAAILFDKFWMCGYQERLGNVYGCEGRVQFIDTIMPPFLTYSSRHKLA